MALSEQVYRVGRSTQARPYEVTTRTVWHGYLLSQEEKRQIDFMMGRAMLDDKFCDRLLKKRDSSLFAEYGLSNETQKWLRSIEASSLSELAQAITYGH